MGDLGGRSVREIYEGDECGENSSHTRISHTNLSYKSLILIQGGNFGERHGWRMSNLPPKILVRAASCPLNRIDLPYKISHTKCRVPSEIFPTQVSHTESRVHKMIFVH